MVILNCSTTKIKGECPVCGKDLGKEIYAHLFPVHDYTKDEIRRLQQARLQKSVVSESYSDCGTEASTSWTELSRMQCPQCEYYVRVYRRVCIVSIVRQPSLIFRSICSDLKPLLLATQLGHCFEVQLSIIILLVCELIVRKQVQ
ncbi:hypothetical protein Y032_0126g1358 [Ancylostoma ceylanicum]|uniref:Uncharacterized protein n=1 Tax=Ancylostoma ceylanicum TaxID=53326 RepID=A0A016T7W0_9BILA|nr:hypothetical protein Y032_0126g1358 [Ancylostoma ceylanicum]